MFEEIFAKKKISPTRLIEHGFEKTSDGYCRTTEVMDGEYLLHIIFDRHGNVDTSLTETQNGEEYSLYKTTAQGTYVGRVRESISDILREVAESCFESSLFRQRQTQKLLEYAANIYGDEPEFLWESTPNNAILRRKDSGKWYGAILTIPRSKLGIDSKQVVEVIDLHAEPERIKRYLHRENFYPGWHMNKKSWYTVILDESVEDEELFRLLDESYRLAQKNHK